MFNNNTASGATGMHVMCGGLPCLMNLTGVVVQSNRYEHAGAHSFWGTHVPEPGYGYSCGQYGAAAVYMSDYAPGSTAHISYRCVWLVEHTECTGAVS